VTKPNNSLRRSVWERNGSFLLTQLIGSSSVGNRWIELPSDIFDFVDRGLEAIGLADFQHVASIQLATSNYLEGQVQVSQLRHLANNLKQKQGK
jgi:hypothetical protein